MAEKETTLSFGEDPHAPDVLYAGAESGVLSRSSDRGETWQEPRP